MLGSRFGFSCLHNKRFTHRAISPIPPRPALFNNILCTPELRLTNVNLLRVEAPGHNAFNQVPLLKSSKTSMTPHREQTSSTRVFRHSRQHTGMVPMHWHWLVLAQAKKQGRGGRKTVRKGVKHCERRGFIQTGSGRDTWLCRSIRGLNYKSLLSPHMSGAEALSQGLETG